MSSLDAHALRGLVQDMHSAAYGTGADLDRLHAAEDEAARILGVRVVRGDQVDLVTPRQLHSLCYAAIKAAEQGTRA